MRLETPPGREKALRQFSHAARELGRDRIAADAEAIADRLAEGQFYVACVGQFKRGKSTLLDALIADPVLPTGIVPVTAVPTIVRYGRSRAARVRLAGGSWRETDPGELAAWVSEEQNPENCKAVVGTLLFVLNKADRVSETERQAAAGFARSVLERRLRRPIDRIFEVSATEQLNDQVITRDWQSLQETLRELARTSGIELVRAAGDRAVTRIGQHLLADIAEQRSALHLPIEDTERRVAALDGVIGDAEQSMIELGYLLFAEQQRLSRTFEADRQEFLARTAPDAHRELGKAIARIASRWGTALRSEMLARAQEIARASVLPWLDEQQVDAEKAYRRASARFVELGSSFLARLASAGGAGLRHLGDSLQPDRGFQVRSSFYFNELIHIAQPASPFRLILDIVLGVLGIRGPFERAAHGFLDRLLVMNATRVQSDVDDRVVESRRVLETEIRTVLTDVRAGAQRALERAREARAAGAEAIETESSRLDTLEQAVREAMAP